MLLRRLKRVARQMLLARLRVPRDVVRVACARYRDRTALITREGSLTYAELEARILSLASAWEALGVRPGTHVVALLPEARAQVEVRLAAYETGAVLTAFHAAHDTSFVMDAIRALAPSVVVIDPVEHPDVSEWLRSEMPEVPVLHAGPSGSYERAIATSRPRRSKHEVRPEYPAAVGFTSGTTGTPKALFVRQGVMVESLRLLAANLRNMPDGMGVTMSAIPLAGAGSGLLLPAFLGGSALLVMEKYDITTLPGLIAKYSVTRLFVTPSQLIDLLDLPPEDQSSLISLTGIIYGSAPTPAVKLEEAVRRFGPILQQGYGMAEVLPPVALLYPEEHATADGAPASRTRLHSVGRVVPQVEVRVLDDVGRPLPADSIGEIAVRSPTVFSGYWNRPDLTSSAIVDGWYHTSDFGFFDGDGYLHVLDRRADLVRRGDTIVYPRDVEEVAHEHAAVKEACLVSGSEDSELVLCVSLRRAHRQQPFDVIAASIHAVLAERLSPGQVPDRVLLCDELPRSHLRKVLRKDVRAAVRSSSFAVTLPAALDAD